MNTLKLSQFKSTYLGKFPHKYKTYTNCKENQLLFDTLESQGYFNFYINNNKHIVSHHCIIAWWFVSGHVAYKNGFTAPAKEINVHHIDGNTFNNSASNLVYVTTDSHSLISRHQRASNKFLKVFKKGILHHTNKSIWNRKGNLIYNYSKWLANLILKTVVLTARHNQLDINLKQISRWFRKITNCLKLNLDSTYIPTYFLVSDETEELLPQFKFNFN